jgi:hypothetical protein
MTLIVMVKFALCKPTYLIFKARRIFIRQSWGTRLNLSKDFINGVKRRYLMIISPVELFKVTTIVDYIFCVHGQKDYVKILEMK